MVPKHMSNFHIRDEMANRLDQQLQGIDTLLDLLAKDGLGRRLLLGILTLCH